MLKTLGTALLLASGLAINAAPALAMQIVVTQVDKNTDGSMTYHFAVKLDQGETLATRASKDAADFVTVYNFYGLVDGSVKSPAGWEFSSENSGRTPAWNGYPLVLPVDVPNTPNAELMLPELECQTNIWRMGLVEQHLAEIELKLRPGKDFGIGVVAEAVLALRPDDVHEAPEVQRQVCKTHWEEPDEFDLRGGAEADGTAMDKARVRTV